MMFGNARSEFPCGLIGRFSFRELLRARERGGSQALSDEGAPS